MQNRNIFIQVCKSFLGAFMLVTGGFFTGNAHASEKTIAYSNAYKMVQSEEFKSAIKAIVKAQGGGDDTVMMSNLLTEAYAGRIDQVGALKKLGLAKKIKSSMQHTLSLDVNNLEAMEGLVQFHLQAPSVAGGNKERAKYWAEKITAINPVKGRLLNARLLADDGKYKEAETLIDQAIKADPAQADYYLAKGGVQVEQKQYKAAIKAYEGCIKIDANNTSCQYQLGKTAQIGNVELAKGIAAFQTFIKIGAEDKNHMAYAHYRLGNIYKQMNDKPSAKAQYTLAVKTDNLKKAKKALQELK